MTLNPWDSFWCTSAVAASRGRGYPPRLRKRSTKRSATRSSPPPSRHWPRGTLRNSLFTWTTAAASSLKRSPTLATSASFSRTFSTAWGTNTISSSTGWSRNKTLLSPWSREMRTTRMSPCRWVPLRLTPLQVLAAISSYRKRNYQDRVMLTHKIECST